MEHAALEDERRAEERARPPEPPVRAPLLALQASAGNQAVTRMLQRVVTGKDPKKRNATINLQSVEDVLNGVFEQSPGSYKELDQLLKDDDAKSALEALLESKDAYSVADAPKLIARIKKDAEAAKGGRRKEARKVAEEKQKERKEAQKALGSGKEEKKAFVPSTTRGLVDPLYNLCAPLYGQPNAAAKESKPEISKALRALIDLAEKLDRDSALKIIGSLGDQEIQEVCRRAGLANLLGQLENTLREVVEAEGGDEFDLVDYLHEKLTTALPWLTPKLLREILEERGGIHGTTSLSAQLDVKDALRKYDEVIFCAPLIASVSTLCNACFGMVGYETKKPIEQVLLHKVIAGNVRRFKLQTLQRCAQQFVQLTPLLLDHKQMAGAAKKGLCVSLCSVFDSLNSKHFVRDERQMIMLLSYLSSHPEAVCSRYAFKIKDWEFDIEIEESGQGFILEVESLNAGKSDPTEIVEYLRNRHKIKQLEAQAAFDGTMPKVFLAVPAVVPEAALKELGPMVLMSGSTRPESQASGEGEEQEDDGED